MRRRLENPFSTRATWDTWFDLVSVPGSTLKSRRVGFLISVTDPILPQSGSPLLVHTTEYLL
jgi:hypothetical protein